MMPDSKKIVRKGYNRISRSYRDDRGQGRDAQNMLPWIRWVELRLNPGDRVLELGCGMGIPVAKHFARDYSYLGVDISDVQIQRAKKLVPAGKFRRTDMGRLRFPHSRFAAILGFYSIIHLPLKEQKPLLKRVYRWLKPGGLFVVILGQGRWTGREKDWFGAEMFWSHADHDTYRRWLQKIGFKILLHKPVKEAKPGKAVHYLFFCVKK
jgi:SAM-dependent methyltransferase